MVGKLDKEIIEKFKEFQEKTGKHCELYIEDIEFEEKTLNNICLITMGQSPKGEYLNKNGEGIPFYQGKTDYGDIYLDKPSTWTIKSKKEAKKNDILISLRAPAGSINIANIDLSIGRGLASIRCSDKVALFYLYYYLKNNEMKISNDNENGGFFSSMNKDYLYDISVPIPKDLNKIYSSYQIQEAIVEFLEYSFKEIKTIQERIDKRYAIFKRLKKALIPSTFIKDYVKVAFGRYAKEKDISFNITDVEFEIKRIHSNKKNDEDVICKKRMGFTPKTSKTDDINWFRVEDLNDINGLYIEEPNTVKKTTIDKVIAKNGKTSSKNIPIQKGDILVSFLATPGIVKIYNSDKVSYCNQALDILTSNEGIDNKYLAYNCMLEYPKYGKKQTMGVNLDNFEKMKIKIFIPKDLENYSSLEIQKIIADFIEYTENRLQNEFERMDRGYHNLERLHKTYLARTFSLIDWGAK